VRLTIEIDLDQLPEPKGKEVGRILRYWAGAANQLDLTAGVEHELRDSAYKSVGTFRIE
jgi:hypothetical protein